jgi:hypothetical protein
VTRKFGSVDFVCHTFMRYLQPGMEYPSLETFATIFLMGRMPKIGDIEAKFLASLPRDVAPPYIPPRVCQGITGTLR